MRKPIFILFILVSCFLVLYGNGYARVSGPCSNCHTMHNSQDGTAMAVQLNSSYSGFEKDATPNNALLVSNCLGCHSSANSGEAISGIGAPIVYTIGAEPGFGFNDGTYQHGLAGGNFYWVLNDDAKGHNVFLGKPDSKLTNAPGSVTSGPHNTCSNQAEACHASLANSTGSQFGFSYSRQGCTKCHMIESDPPQGLHHLDDSGDPKIVNSAAQGWYRFLAGHRPGAGQGHGVSGIEDTDWQATYGSDDHNEYLGIAYDKTSVGGFGYIGNTITAYCTGCHGIFHRQDTTTDGSSPWLRHPSDAVVPDSGEYASAFGASGGPGTYDPQVPVARADISGGVLSTVTLDSDMVMCLSCHRPHGSPYDDMLRWDYTGGMIAGGGGSGGCFQCHTRKN